MVGDVTFRRSMVRTLVANSVVLILVGLSNITLGQDAGQAIEPALTDQAAADEDSELSQRRVDEMDNQTSESIADNRLALQALNRLKIYNGNLDRVVQDQEREKLSLESQITNFGDVERDVVPLMFEMIDALEAFVEQTLAYQAQVSASQ